MPSLFNSLHTHTHTNTQVLVSKDEGIDVRQGIIITVRLYKSKEVMIECRQLTVDKTGINPSRRCSVIRRFLVGRNFIVCASVYVYAMQKLCCALLGWPRRPHCRLQVVEATAAAAAQSMAVQSNE